MAERGGKETGLRFNDDGGRLPYRKRDDGADPAIKIGSVQRVDPVIAADRRL